MVHGRIHISMMHLHPTSRFLIVGSTRTQSGTNQDSLSDWTTIINQGIQLCEARKDCILVASPRKTLM